MKRRTKAAPWLIMLLVAAASVGCSGGEDIPELVAVEGVVTINGTPTKDLRLTFEPNGGEDVGFSVGTTDETGKYTLQYKGEHAGVPAGSYRVLITNLNQADVPMEQMLPPKYNISSTLTADVSASSTSHDFKLTTSGG